MSGQNMCRHSKTVQIEVGKFWAFKEDQPVTIITDFKNSRNQFFVQPFIVIMRGCTDFGHTMHSWCTSLEFKLETSKVFWCSINFQCALPSLISWGLRITDIVFYVCHIKMVVIQKIGDEQTIQLLTTISKIGGIFYPFSEFFKFRGIRVRKNRDNNSYEFQQCLIRIIRNDNSNSEPVSNNWRGNNIFIELFNWLNENFI